MIARGRLRGDKIEYEDGIGCCVWIPFVDDEGNVKDEDIGICFDFSLEDLDDMIALLIELRTCSAKKVDDG